MNEMVARSEKIYGWYTITMLTLHFLRWLVALSDWNDQEAS